MPEKEGPCVSVSYALCCVCVADSLNCVEWSLLPPATEEMITQTAGLKGRFQGDPSYEYSPIEKKGEENERMYDEEGGVSTTSHFLDLSSMLSPNSCSQPELNKLGLMLLPGNKPMLGPSLLPFPTRCECFNYQWSSDCSSTKSYTCKDPVIHNQCIFEWAPLNGRSCREADGADWCPKIWGTVALEEG